MAAFDTSRTSYGTDGAAGRIGTFFSSLAGALAAWNDARVTRNALSRLSDRELEDIGMVRGDIDDVARGRGRF